jgi:acyl-CoA thioesterase-1
MSSHSDSRIFRRSVIASVLALGLMGVAGTAAGATINIVALGASNTAGRGVDRSAAWPAQLESMLRAKGYDVNMSVTGVLGATSAMILSGVDSAVRPGTQVVVFDTGADNDRKRDVPESGQQAHLAQIQSRIRALGARPIRALYGNLPRQGDGTHLTAEAHARVAARLVPQVLAALGRRR